MLISLIKKLTFGLIAALLLIAIVAAGSVYAIYSGALSAHPNLTSFQKMKVEDIKRIKYIALQANAPKDDQRPHNLDLNERDINLAITHFAPNILKLPDATYIAISLNEDIADIHLTMPAELLTDQTYLKDNGIQLIPLLETLRKKLQPHLNEQWVNLSWSFTLKETILEAQRFSIGSLDLPRSLSQALFLEIKKQALSHPNSQQLTDMLSLISKADLKNSLLSINYQLPDSATSNLTSYQSLVLSPDEQAVIEIYSQQLEKLPQSGPLITVIKRLFTLTIDRSEKNNDPITENRAALLALAKRFGGDQLIGMLNDNQTANITPPPSPHTLYRRKDLAQHLVLSAAVTLLADGELADLIGLDKELSDLQGGRRISAWDLLADRAGVRLANRATQSTRSARDTQQLLANLEKDGDLLPDLGRDFYGQKDRFFKEDLPDLNFMVELSLDQLKLYEK